MHRLTTAIWVALLAVGCNSPNPGRKGGSTGGTSGGTTGGTTGGTSGGTSGGTTGGTTGVDGGDTSGDNCGVQNFMLQKGLPPDLLIVLDRSGSMGDPPPSGGGSKWSQITAAINQTVGQLQGQIKWGLEIFPSDDSCGVGSTVDVAIAANNPMAISTAIAAKMPGGDTPTADAIHDGATYLQSIGDQNPKYILIATDGEPNCSKGGGGGTCTCPAPTTMMNGQCCFVGACIPCPGNLAGGPDDAGAEQAIADALKQGVGTFVVGIAADSTDDAVLTQMSTDGGHPRNGTPNYYNVSSTNDLVTAVNQIAGQIISCTFPLQMAPPHPDYVDVQADMTSVPHDTTHMNGWDYGPGNTSIQFYGTYCDKLQSGSITNVQAVFGCGPVS